VTDRQRYSYDNSVKLFNGVSFLIVSVTDRYKDILKTIAGAYYAVRLKSSNG